MEACLHRWSGNICQLHHFRKIALSIYILEALFYHYSNVTTFDSVPCRIGAGLTQCTFYRLKQRETQQNEFDTFITASHISHIQSEISQFALKHVTDVTDLTDLTDLTVLTQLTECHKKGLI